MLHKLLSTQERIARLGLNEDQPRLCLHSRLGTENLVHFFFDCIKKMQVGLALIGCFKQVLQEAALLLDFGCCLQEEETESRDLGKGNYSKRRKIDLVVQLN